MPSPQTGFRSHLTRWVLIFFALVYLLNYFMPIEALKYLGSILLLYVVVQAMGRLPKVNRRVVLGLFLIGAVLLFYKGASPLEWIISFTKNANLVTLFICVPMMSMPFFYEDYQGELKNVAQTRMRQLLPFCMLVALSTHILGVLISVGAVAIIYELMSPNAKLYHAEDIFLTTLLRSYNTSGFWSPAWASVVVVTTQLEISWIRLIPIGVGLALFMNLLDMLSVFLKTKREPQRYVCEAGSEDTTVNWKRIVIMLVLALTLIALIVLLSVITPWNLMIIIPLVSISFPILIALIQRRGLEYKQGIAKYYNHGLVKVQNEVTLFTAAGFLGKALEYSGVGEMLPGLIPSWMQSYPPLLLASIMLMIILPSLIGIHPVVTGTALVTAVVPAAFGLSNMTFALTVLTGWLLAILLSPFSATALMASGFTGKASWSISLGLNGRFGFLCVALFSLLVSILGPLLS